MTYLYAALAGCALMLASFVGGCQHERDAIEAKAASVRAQDLAIALKMEPSLERTITQTQTKTVTLIQKVPTYVDRYIPAPGAASTARPAYFLTYGAWGLWNAALSPGTAADPASAPAGTDPLELSPVTFNQAETNALRNFGQYESCRTVVKGWQDWYSKVSHVR